MSLPLDLSYSRELFICCCCCCCCMRDRSPDHINKNTFFFSWASEQKWGWKEIALRKSFKTFFCFSLIGTSDFTVRLLHQSSEKIHTWMNEAFENWNKKSDFKVILMKRKGKVISLFFPKIFFLSDQSRYVNQMGIHIRCKTDGDKLDQFALFGKPQQ